MFDFSQRIVLVTGGTGNLGGAIVSALTAAGAHVIIPDRSAGVAARFPELAATDAHLLVDNIDATSEADNERLAALIAEKYGHLDVLINTVGGFRAGSLPHETDVRTWELMLSLNARTTFLSNKVVIPLMLERGGRIVNTASKNALAGSASDMAYAASKSAVARITESFAAAYKKQGITVNAVLPGTLDTPQNRDAMPNADFSKWIPLDKLAQLYLFLASDAGSIINGALIPAYGPA
jgi:NAD(P)-dependent dehydrogenase (short-subunit alcohol dehydrogenase family)